MEETGGRVPGLRASSGSWVGRESSAFSWLALKLLPERLSKAATAGADTRPLRHVAMSSKRRRMGLSMLD
jgi:hypothetical protein